MCVWLSVCAASKHQQTNTSSRVQRKNVYIQLLNTIETQNHQLKFHW